MHEVAMHGLNFSIYLLYISSSTGFNPIQTKLAEYNGSQCGYCSPGFVMSMYRSLTHSIFHAC